MTTKRQIERHNERRRKPSARALVPMLLSLALAFATPAQAQTPEWNRTAIQPAIGDPSMAYDSDRGVTLCFGGYTSRSDTYEWDGAQWARQSTTGPSPRFGHAMAYDAARHVTVMFGGASGDVSNDETWAWNGAARSWTRLPVAGPPARRYSAMVYDSGRNVCILFGGSDGDALVGLLGDTWEWNGAVWTERTNPPPTPSPSPRSVHAMAYDSARHRTVLFGGATGLSGNMATLSAETWEWDGALWSLRSNGLPAPSSRAAHAMAFDSGRGVAVVFGGYVGGTLDNPLYGGDTWEWNGTAWRMQAISGPAPRAQHIMSFDSSRNLTVLRSGYTQGNIESAETWELVVTPRCTADFDDGSGTGTPDGGVTIDDLLYYIVVFSDGSIAADVDDGSATGSPDGGVTIDDLLYYLARFDAGC